MTVSESKRRNNDKYNMKCDFIAIKPLKPVGESIRQAAKDSGMSLQGYILNAVDRQMSEDRYGKEIPGEVVAKTIEWLKAKGHSDEDVLDLLKYWGNKSDD